MDPVEYSAVADLLAKFHSSSDGIKFVWLIVVPGALGFITWCVVDLLKTIMRALLLRRWLRDEPVLLEAEPGRPRIAGSHGELWLLRLSAPAFDGTDEGKE